MPGTVEFHLLCAGGEYFGRLTRGDAIDRYTLDALTGARLHLWGSFDIYTVNITDDEGKLLATTEPCNADFDFRGEYYRVRMAPLTDVGLVLCSLFCIYHLGEGQE